MHDSLPAPLENAPRAACQGRARAVEPFDELGGVGNDEPGGGGRRRRARNGVSCSWPTAETTGTGHAATARTSRSSLNGSRSSKLPPPRVSTITSTSGAAQTSRSASIIAVAAKGPCTYVSATTTRAAGNRAVIVASTSRFAAASFPVTSPMRRGRNGSGRLRSKTPSAASFFFSRSSAARWSPSPKRSIDSARMRKSPFASNSSGLPKTCTRSPSERSSRNASKRERAMVTPRHAPSFGSLSVKKTDCQRTLRRSSVTSPSTQIVGKRPSQSATPRLNDATV